MIIIIMLIWHKRWSTSLKRPSTHATKFTWHQYVLVQSILMLMNLPSSAAAFFSASICSCFLRTEFLSSSWYSRSFSFSWLSSLKHKLNASLMPLEIHSVKGLIVSFYSLEIQRDKLNKQNLTTNKTFECYPMVSSRRSLSLLVRGQLVLRMRSTG